MCNVRDIKNMFTECKETRDVVFIANPVTRHSPDNGSASDADSGVTIRQSYSTS